jgi:hypothetical protein
LVNLAMEQAVASGFMPMVAPALVKPETMEGIGFLGAHTSEVYRLAEDDLYLVGTSEVALGCTVTRTARWATSPLDSDVHLLERDIPHREVMTRCRHRDRPSRERVEEDCEPSAI